MQTLNIAKIGKVIFFGLTMLFLCGNSDWILDFCYDAFCINESDELLLSDLEYSINLFCANIWNISLVLSNDSHQEWWSVWLYSVYVRLKTANTLSLTLALQFTTLLQQFISYLNGYCAFNKFQNSIKEESSFCLPFV